MSSSSTAVKVFRGCRALLAPSKSSTPAAVKTTAVASKPKAKPKAKPKPKPKADGDAIKPKRNITALTGILKPNPISPALGSFIGAPEASRAEAVKQIWAHIKLHNLQNPDNKREIQCDEKLKELFEGKETVNFLEIGKLLSRHFVKAA